MPLSTIAVYCASSQRVDAEYFEAARRTGTLLARAGLAIVYGGGRSGLMGALADAAMESGGHVTGVIPVDLNAILSRGARNAALFSLLRWPFCSLLLVAFETASRR